MENANTQMNQIDLKDGFYTTELLRGTLAATSTNYTHFFTAYWACEVVGVSEVHTVAGTNGSPVTLQLNKVTNGTAPASGTSILNVGFDLKSTANTPVTKTGRDLVFNSGRQLKRGERLALETTGTLTDLADVLVTVYLKMLGRGSYR